MNPDEQEIEAAHFELWEGELPAITTSTGDEEIQFAIVEWNALPEEPGFFRQLLAWLRLVMVVSLPWAAGFLLVITIVKAFQ